MTTTRSMTREIGTAFAVLAIYLLTILAPLHQARASQIAFQDLGYATHEAGWVLCAAGETGEDRDVTIAKCPAAGIGKTDVVEPGVAALPPVPDRALLAAPLLMPATAWTPSPALPPNGSRAPPAPV